MPELCDLLLDLRDGDEHLAAVAPAADLEARFRTRLRAEARSMRKAERPAGRRMQRPLVLALATCAAVIAVTSSLQTPPEPARITSSSSAPEEAVRPDKTLADGGPVDPTLNAPSLRRPPVIHAPALQEDAARRAWSAPEPVLRSPSTPRAPATSPSPPREIPAEETPIPWTPAEPRKEGPRKALPPAGPWRDLPPGPLPAPTSGAAPGHARAPSHDSAPPAAPAPAPSTGPTEAPDVSCKSTALLEEEAGLLCKSEGQALADVVHLDPCGDGRFRRVEVTCEDPALPEGCITGEVGDGVTCQDVGLMKNQAYDICQQAKLELTVYDVNNNGCTHGESRRAEYTCCGPDGQCINGEISDEFLCLTFAALHDQAADACASAGLEVTGVQIDNEGCQYLDSTRARYACCPAAPQKP